MKTTGSASLSSGQWPTALQIGGEHFLFTHSSPLFFSDGTEAYVGNTEVLWGSVVMSCETVYTIRHHTHGLVSNQHP